MKKMGVWTKRIVSTGLSLALIFGISSANYAMLSNKGLDTVQAASAVSRQSIHDGAILHAFCWDFNTIKANMPKIKDAGYTAIQTSPINTCLSIYDGKMLYGETEAEGRWYYHYQPTDWKIGNYQLGNKEEFKAMCEEADKYGIGVIVDIDPNHTTPLYDQVSNDLKNAAGGEEALYHKGSKVENGDQGGMRYDDRISVTYDAMGGLPDVDTENEGFQEYFYDFLEDCIDCGADGFRIDTAKHISLPDDGVPEEYTGDEKRNDFYPNMKADINANASKSYADLFVYGEVLDGDASRVAAYQDMLGGTCASNYGGSIRNAVSSGNVACDRILNYKIKDDSTTGTTYKADENKLITWVESHDNYINDKSYNSVDDNAVILGWAIIAARQAGTPLFFSRPMDSSKDNPWGTNQIGAAGSDIYQAPEVKAVNNFRIAMAGESEYLRNPGGNNSVIMIERGTKGVVIVNVSDGTFALDTETNLSDGTYKDSVEGREDLYTVVDGQLTGSIPAKSVVVLDTPADGEYSTLFFHNTNKWSNISAVVDGDSYSTVDMGYDWFKTVIPKEEFKVEFTDGTNKSNEYSIKKTSGKFMTAKSSKLYETKAEAEKALGIETTTVYFFNTDGWNTVNAYAWYDGGEQIFGGWPGKVIISEGNYWWKAELKTTGDKPKYIIFNDGKGTQTENITLEGNTGNYYAISAKQSEGNLKVDKYSSKSEAEEALGINGDSTTVYYYNAAGWEQVGVYTWGDVDLGSWPGALAEDDGNGWWKLTINAAPSTNFNIIFNNHVQGDDGKRQTEDLKVDSLKQVYFIGSKYKYTSKEAALNALENDNLVLEKNLGGNTTEKPKENTNRPIEEESELVEGTVKIYYYNASDWNQVNMYAWTDGANTEYFRGWPGQKMDHIGDGWYSVNVDEKALTHEGLHLIANNGEGAQLNNVELITERPEIKQKKEEEPKQPEQPTEPTQPSQPAVNPSTPNNNGASGSSTAQSNSSTSAPAVSTPAQATTQITAADVPTAANSKVVTSEKKKTTKIESTNNKTKGKSETVTTKEKEAAEDTSETEEAVEDANISIDTLASNDTKTSISDEATPAAAAESNFPIIPVVALVIALAAAATAATVVFKRKN